MRGETRSAREKKPKHGRKTTKSIVSTVRDGIEPGTSRLKATARKTAPEGQKEYVRLHQAVNVLLPDQHFSNDLPLRKIQRFRVSLIHVYLLFFFTVKVLYLGCYEEQPFDPLFPEEFLDYRYDIDWSTYPDMGVK